MPTLTSEPLSPTVENYLKHLFEEQPGDARELLPMGRLAAAMAVTPGTATAMVKSLDEAGLVEYEPRDGVRLTAAGERHALRVIRRHRLIELFLVETLGLDWSEVHAEAEELEHAISDKVLDKLDAFLGHPKFDPHGDPIPRASGEVSKRSLDQLAASPTGRALRIARVLGQDAEFLQALRRLGLTPGQVVVVTAHDPHAGVQTLRLRDKSTVNLGTAAAAKILVEPA